MEQKQVEQKPVEQKPMEQKPVEQKPVREKQVEQSKRDRALDQAIIQACRLVTRSCPTLSGTRRKLHLNG